MGDFIKKNLVTILILGGTLVLAGIAIFTAIRLYQLRSVAPNAPSSAPKAAGQACGGLTGAVCPTGEQCVFDNGSTRPPFPEASGTCEVAASPRGTAAPNNAICSISFTLAAATPSPTPTPVPQCYEACTTPGQQANCPSGLTCQAIGGNNICVNPSCTGNSNCVCSTATPTPTPTPTPSPTPGAPNACNGSCGSNSNCQSGMVCNIASGAVSGFCRNPQCLTDTDCICGTATPRPTATPTASPAPQLPVAGVETPTILGIVAGILFIVGAIALAL